MPQSVPCTFSREIVKATDGWLGRCASKFGDLTIKIPSATLREAFDLLRHGRIAVFSYAKEVVDRFETSDLKLESAGSFESPRR